MLVGRITGMTNKWVAACLQFTSRVMVYAISYRGNVYRENGVVILLRKKYRVIHDHMQMFDGPT